MNEQNVFQLWLSMLSLALAGCGAVIWYFARKVLEMPMTYATKPDLKEASDGWKNEMRQMREERRTDQESTQRKLDKIDDTVTGIHRRIDMLFQRSSEG